MHRHNHRHHYFKSGKIDKKILSIVQSIFKWKASKIHYVTRFGKFFPLFSTQASGCLAPLLESLFLMKDNIYLKMSIFVNLFPAGRVLEATGDSFQDTEALSIFEINPMSVLGFPCGSDGKESSWSAGDLSSIPGLGRPPGEWNGYSLHYSCLENSRDRGAG